MQARFDYAGCAVFVAGGTSGINLGIARAFAAAGARVGVGSRQPGQGRRRARRASAPSARLRASTCATRRPSRQRSTAFAAAAGPIDVLVSGAAGNFPALRGRLSPNGFKAVVDIDLLGTFHVMKAAYPHMRRPGGSLINISAPQALRPMAMQVARLRRQGRRRHGHPLPRHRMGARGLARQRRHPRADRRHRGHGPARPDAGSAGGGPPAACRCAAGAPPRTWPAPASFSARRRQPTSTARSCPPTAAGR